MKLLCSGLNRIRAKCTEGANWTWGFTALVGSWAKLWSSFSVIMDAKEIVVFWPDSKVMAEVNRHGPHCCYGYPRPSF